MQILTSPLMPAFLDLVRNASEKLWLVSPFVKRSVAQMVLDNFRTDAELELLTSFRLPDFHRASSDLPALRLLAERGAHLSSYERLHAKIFVADDALAIITSSNLTLAGLTRNFECGCLVDDGEMLRALTSSLQALHEDTEKTYSISLDAIAITERILSETPKAEAPVFSKTASEILAQDTAAQSALYEAGAANIAKHLGGWRRDVFEICAEMESLVFTLADVYAAKSRLQEKHPRNAAIEAKIRQQLQELRDLGLIEFLGGGVYRRLWK